MRPYRSHLPFADAGLVWFYTNDMPLVRMNFNSSVGIEEGDRQNGIGMGQNVPNPANGKIGRASCRERV